LHALSHGGPDMAPKPPILRRAPAEPGRSSIPAVRYPPVLYPWAFVAYVV